MLGLDQWDDRTGSEGEKVGGKFNWQSEGIHSAIATNQSVFFKENRLEVVSLYFIHDMLEDPNKNYFD